MEAETYIAKETARALSQSLDFSLLEQERRFWFLQSASKREDCYLVF